MIDKRSIWDRDSYRCQECGIQVAQPRGLRPHIHHVVPRNLGGSDHAKNLITLCQPCHETKLGHMFMLERVDAVDFPQYIKWMLWDLSLNLVAYADSLDPRNFPEADQIRQHLTALRQALMTVEMLCADCRDAGIGSGAPTFSDDLVREQRQLAQIMEGMRIAWTAHYTQRAFDQIIAESAQKRRIPCPACGTSTLEYSEQGGRRGFTCADCGHHSQGWRQA